MINLSLRLHPSGNMSPTARQIAGNSQRARKREIELDFVRGLAILMVLDYHSGSHWLSKPFSLLGFPNFGWVGVDVFFVLSGFLVGGLLVKEKKVDKQIDAKRFLVRRAFKVWPQYYVYLAVILATGHRSVHDLWGNLLNVQNYTGGIPHTWSLAVEEHAYLLLVLCLLLASRWNLRMRSLFWGLIVASASVAIGRLVLMEHGHEVVTRTHTRIEGIFYGVILAILYHYAPERFRSLQKMKWLWFAGLAIALIFLRFQTSRPWSVSVGWDMANLLGICLLMLLYRPGGSKVPRPLLYRAIAWIGVYSYGIYLWHVSVLAPTAALGRRMPDWLEPLWTGLASLVAGIALGSLFTKVVEFPMLRLRDRWFPRPVDTPVGVPAVVENRVSVYR